ncbi:MAG: thioredoxin, partial [Thermoprotei archaeon]
KVEDRTIHAVPTSIYYEQGKEVWRREGIIKYGELLKMLK